MFNPGSIVLVVEPDSLSLLKCLSCLLKDDVVVFVPGEGCCFLRVRQFGDICESIPALNWMERCCAAFLFA